MTEWWTYGLSDFLMFSPAAYWRLVARYNAVWWPGQVLAVAAGLTLWLQLRRSTAQSHRVALVVLAGAWAWVGWAFFAQRYAEIFVAARWVGAACGAQAVALVAAAAWPASEPRGTQARPFGWALVAIGLLYPLLSVMSRRGWNEAEVFGFMPDPTALVTLGALLALPQLAPALRVLLAVTPLAIFALGMATRWLIA